MEPDSNTADGPPKNSSQDEEEEVLHASNKKRIGSGRPKSYVWDHFTDAITSEHGKSAAQCNYCNERIISYKGHLKDLRNHLENDCDKLPEGIRKTVTKLNKLHRAQQRAKPKPKPIKQRKEKETKNKRGYVWDHFTEVKNDENKRIAQCVYCDYRLSAFTVRMRNHLERNCKAIPNATRRKVAELNRIHDRALQAKRLNGDEVIDQEDPLVQEQQLQTNRDEQQRTKTERRGRKQAMFVFPSTAASSIYQQPQQPQSQPSSRVQQMQTATNFVHVDDDAPSWAISMAASINSNFNTQFATLSSQLSSLSSQLASQTANLEAQLMNANARISNIELHLQLKHQSSSNKRARGHDTSRPTWDSEEDETEEEYYSNDDSEEEDYEDAEEFI